MARLDKIQRKVSELYHQKPLIKVFTEDRAEYIFALNDSEENENPDIFRNFICKQQIKFYKAEIKKFAKLKSGFTLLI